MTQPAEVDLARALDYPYDLVPHSFVFDPGSGPRRAGDDELRALATGRHAVLAVGSNAAPAQLARKFPASRWRGRPMAVVRTILVDHDVAYAARVVSYGSAAATLAPSAGTRVRLHITFLDDAQFEHMNSTEGLGSSYDLLDVDAALVECAVGTPPVVRTYTSRAGLLQRSGTPVALAAIEAEARRYPALDQRQVLEWVAARHGLSLEPFVRRAVSDAAFRREVNVALR